MMQEKNIPGPAYYNATKEPAKISFLFNPAEHWAEIRGERK